MAELIDELEPIVDDRTVADPYRYESIRKELAGLRHHWQRSMSEEADLNQQVRLLRKQVVEIEAARKADMTRICELMDRLDKASSVIKMMREEIKELKLNYVKKAVA